MRNRFLVFCLALVLALSMIPAQLFADSSSQNYTVIATGVEATDIAMMNNGYCAYRVLDGYMIPRKGVIAPSGKAVVTRDFGDDPIYMGVSGTTHAVGYGTVIVDLPPYVRSSADGSAAWEDMPIYDTDGRALGNVTDIINKYAGWESGAISARTASLGDDGYLTVNAETEDRDYYYVYIIDLRKMEVCFSQNTYTTWLPEGASVGTVNEGLIAYSKTYTEDGEDGWTTTTTSAGWMDLSGKQVIAIDSDKYVSWEDFSNGRAAVLQDSPRAYGYFDKSGKLAIPCKYMDAGMFMDGYAAVCAHVDRDDFYGYIDTADKTVIPFQYDDACGYGEGLFTVGVRVLSGDWWLTKYGMVDKSNTVVVPCEYDQITPVKNGAAYAIKDGKVFVLKFAQAEPEPQPAPADPNDVTGIFEDVPADAWYAKFLQNAYNKIIAGMSATTYAPAANLNHGQIMVMAANLHSKMKGDGYDFQANKKIGEAWYQVFEDYCKAEGIIDGRFDGKETQNVTRAEMAYYFARTLEDKYYKNKKTVSFSDMPKDGYDEFILKLAKADIVGGYNDGTFKPGAFVTRAEASVFVSNILDAIE